MPLVLADSLLLVHGAPILRRQLCLQHLQLVGLGVQLHSPCPEQAAQRLCLCFLLRQTAFPHKCLLALHHQLLLPASLRRVFSAFGADRLSLALPRLQLQHRWPARFLLGSLLVLGLCPAETAIPLYHLGLELTGGIFQALCEVPFARCKLAAAERKGSLKVLDPRGCLHGAGVNGPLATLLVLPEHLALCRQLRKAPFEIAAPVLKPGLQVADSRILLLELLATLHKLGLIALERRLQVLTLGLPSADSENLCLLPFQRCPEALDVGVALC
mmetsp:Transcript_12649/g.29703  ORF Transcript_12649/g.29703 Transcript_12649/m.29703 type:complete len:272 (-) Transcript_12649:401-1216(-)